MNIQSPRSTIGKVTMLNLIILLLAFGYCRAQAQSDTTTKVRRNIIRYNLSGALLFGAENYFVLGYERVLKNRQSFSINAGFVGFPKLISIDTDSFKLNNDLKNGGFQVTVDYRFYLKKENKYAPPHGLYIGPYYSFNHFNRENRWFQRSDPDNFITTTVNFNINTIGFQMGYQFILWKRFALDLILIGPGMAYYDYEVLLDGNLTDETKEQIFEALEELGSDRIPGMSYLLEGEVVKGNGSIKSTNLGYRYIVHIGFLF
jgi:hypothetical protein